MGKKNRPNNGGGSSKPSKSSDYWLDLGTYALMGAAFIALIAMAAQLNERGRRALVELQGGQQSRATMQAAGDPTFKPGTSRADPTAELAGLDAAATCNLWRSRGHCTTVSAFMLVHCPGTCAQSELKCKRHAPGDLAAQCPDWASRGACEREWQRGNRYFLAQCFRSCGAHDAPLLLRAMLDEVGNVTSFPSGLANRAEVVGESADVLLEDEGNRVVRVDRLHDSPYSAAGIALTQPQRGHLPGSHPLELDSRRSRRIRLLHNLITDEEAANLIALGKPLLVPSPTMANYRSTVRTSSTAYLVDNNHKALRKVRERSLG